MAMRQVSGQTGLRRLTPEDVDPFLAYRSDPDVAKYQSWEQMDRAQALGFLAHMQSVSPLMRLGHWTQIAVADAISDNLLGDMGWHLNETGTEIELGITLARAAQGKGHATTAMSLAVAYLQQITEVTCFVAYADLRNAPSRALMRRAGITSLGTTLAEDGVEEEAFELLRQGTDR